MKLLSFIVKIFKVLILYKQVYQLFIYFLYIVYVSCCICEDQSQWRHQRTKQTRFYAFKMYYGTNTQRNVTVVAAVEGAGSHGGRWSPRLHPPPPSTHRPRYHFQIIKTQAVRNIGAEIYNRPNHCCRNYFQEVRTIWEIFVIDIQQHGSRRSYPNLIWHQLVRIYFTSVLWASPRISRDLITRFVFMRGTTWRKFLFLLTMTSIMPCGKPSISLLTPENCFVRILR